MDDLTDLIAAHTPHPDYDCGCGWNGDEWAEHVAQVLQQHMRDHFVIPDGYELWNTLQLERLGEEQERNRKSTRETIARWRTRAEEAEATIARVEKLAAEYARDDQEHLNTFGQHHPVAGIAHDHLCAALEGEQQ